MLKASPVLINLMLTTLEEVLVFPPYKWEHWGTKRLRQLQLPSHTTIRCETWDSDPGSLILELTFLPLTRVAPEVQSLERGNFQMGKFLLPPQSY